MKTFIYTVEKRNAKYGWNFSVRIYSVEHNIPKFLMEVGYNSGSYRGHIHEVFNALCKGNNITPEIAELTIQKGYFVGDAIRAHIQIIELS